ncbi:hypothetical protein PGH07_01460 [Sulfurovum sp. zt1-1]|uniref:Uncharacterized protein n=1 Tax=Sulfurovum zhangzhouensis TaxID=3019067 RepID=A0ABT7QVH7_9BACT|nr:hypothetical protein [Sulfurovum zhangzhouensis]MDM5270840.1 hypothetical protein [Sulfurovum zhangzhouensis]
MEHHVIIEKLCSCAKRDGLSQVVTFDTKESAKNAAETQLSFMESSFCGKHNFDITEVDDHYVIGMLGGGCGCGTQHMH